MRLAVLITLIGWSALAALATVAFIGKPRKPITAGTAIAVLITQGLICVATYYLYASAS